MSIDMGFIQRIDKDGDRDYRLRQLKEELLTKKRDHDDLVEEIHSLNDKIRSIGEVNIDTSHFLDEEEYANQLKDLKIGYSDILQSMKDHLAANQAILNKEKDIKEMEARIALIDLDALDEEYEKLRIQYDRDSEILRDLEDRYSLLHDRLVRLRARLRELNDLIRSLEERLHTAHFECEDAERKYALIKVPKRVEYVVNERMEHVVTKKKVIEKGHKIDEHELYRRRKSKIVHVKGKEYYVPSEHELDEFIPEGSRVVIKKDNQREGYYYYGSKEFYFVKGNDGDLYVDLGGGDRMHLDDFISLYEHEEMSKAGRGSMKNYKVNNIDHEEDLADIGHEMEGVTTYKFA